MNCASSINKKIRRAAKNKGRVTLDNNEVQFLINSDIAEELAKLEVQELRTTTCQKEHIKLANIGLKKTDQASGRSAGMTPKQGSAGPNQLAQKIFN